MPPTRTLTAILVLTLAMLTACAAPATPLAETATATHTPEPTATATITPPPTITPTPTPDIPFEADFDVRVEVGDDGEPQYFAELDAGEGLRTYQVTPLAESPILVLTDEAGVNYVYHNGEVVELVDGKYAVVDGGLLAIGDGIVNVVSREGFVADRIEAHEVQGETRYAVVGVDEAGNSVTYEYVPETGEIVEIEKALYINGVKWDDERLAMTFATMPENQGKYQCTSEGMELTECNELLMSLLQEALADAEARQDEDVVVDIPAGVLSTMGVDKPITRMGLTENAYFPRNVYVGRMYLLEYDVLDFDEYRLVVIDTNVRSVFEEHVYMVSVGGTAIADIEIEASFSDSSGDGFEPPKTLSNRQLAVILTERLSQGAVGAFVTNLDFDNPNEHIYGGVFPLN